MALTDKEKQLARLVVEYNGGTANEQARFAALSDEDARAEIEAAIPSISTHTDNEINYVQNRLNLLQAKKLILQQE